MPADIGVRGVARRIGALAGEAHLEDAAIVGRELQALAAEGVVQRLGRHADLARAHHLARSGEEAVDVVVGAADLLLAAGQHAAAAHDPQILHQVSSHSANAQAGVRSIA